MSSELQLRINQALISARENNINSVELVKLLDDCLNINVDHSLAHKFLDAAHLKSISKSIANSDYEEIWFKKLIQLIKKSNYNFGILMKQRADFYNQKNGFDRWYYSNGYLKSEAMYEYDKIVSETLYWDKDGNMLN